MFQLSLSCQTGYHTYLTWSDIHWIVQ